MKFICLLIVSVFIISCSTQNNQNNNTYQSDNGILSSEDFTKLKKTLIDNYGIQLKDTLYIKYEYKNDNCWMNLDCRDDKYIDLVIDSRNEFLQNYHKKQQGITVLHIKEIGKNFNKIVLRNRTILEDRNDFLKNLIFPKKYQCGTSVLVFNNGQYIKMNRDPHFDLLRKQKKGTK